MVKVAIKTFGCSFNQADGLFMQQLLKQAGFELTSLEDADVVILNSCTVKQISENKLFRYIKDFNHKKLIITGCVPQAEPGYVNTKLKNYSILGTGAIGNIVKAVNASMENRRFVDLSISRPPRLSVLLRKNKVVDIVPISQGCAGNCNYCKTKQARFNVTSFPLAIIKQHVIRALQQGVKEFWLTSQDLGAYGLDLKANKTSTIKTNIITLLQELTSIDKVLLLRLGMMNPNYALKYANQFSELLKDVRIFNFLHIPVQSGSEYVVKSMARPHSVDDFIKAIHIIRSAFRSAFYSSNLNLTIATDIIVGYPTETEHNFEETIDLLQKIRPDIVNVSRFWPRPHTKAAKLKQLPTHVIKERSKQLSIICKRIALKKNKRFLNKKVLVFIDELSSRNLKARTLSYKQVVIQNLAKSGEHDSLNKYLGLFAIIKVKEVTHMDLRGDALKVFDIADLENLKTFKI